MVIRSLGQEDPLEEGLQPTLVFLPGESDRQKSLMGYGSQGHKESDTTEAIQHAHTHPHTQASLMAQRVKNPSAMQNAEDMEDIGSIPGSERSPGEGNDNPLQYSFLENPMDIYKILFQILFHYRLL